MQSRQKSQKSGGPSSLCLSSRVIVSTGTEGGLAPGEWVVASATGVQPSDCGQWCFPEPCWWCRTDVSSPGCCLSLEHQLCFLLPYPILQVLGIPLRMGGKLNSTGICRVNVNDKRVCQRQILPAAGALLSQWS